MRKKMLKKKLARTEKKLEKVRAELRHTKDRLNAIIAPEAEPEIIQQSPASATAGFDAQSGVGFFANIASIPAATSRISFASIVMVSHPGTISRIRSVPLAFFVICIV